MKRLLLSLCLACPGSAFAQADGGMVPPTGANYAMRFLVHADTVRVCFFRVSPASDGKSVGVDTNGDGAFDDGDALACTFGPLVSDGVTPNEFLLTVAPVPSEDVTIAAKAYPAEGSIRPPSVLFSNWARLLVALRAPVILTAP